MRRGPRAVAQVLLRAAVVVAPASAQASTGGPEWTLAAGYTRFARCREEEWYGAARTASVASPRHQAAAACGREHLGAAREQRVHDRPHLVERPEVVGSPVALRVKLVLHPHAPHVPAAIATTARRAAAHESREEAEGQRPIRAVQRRWHPSARRIGIVPERVAPSPAPAVGRAER
eukprot:1354654-Prymnesium_polylepis.1